MSDPKDTPLCDLVINPKKKITRPPNAFMIFGKEYRKKFAERYPGVNNTQISKMLGEAWQKADDTTKETYYRKADELQDLHKRTYPDYSYNPNKARVEKLKRKEEEANKRAQKRTRRNAVPRRKQREEPKVILFPCYPISTMNSGCYQALSANQEGVYFPMGLTPSYSLVNCDESNPPRCNPADFEPQDFSEGLNSLEQNRLSPETNDVLASNMPRSLQQSFVFDSKESLRSYLNLPPSSHSSAIEHGLSEVSNEDSQSDEEILGLPLDWPSQEESQTGSLNIIDGFRYQEENQIPNFLSRNLPSTITRDVNFEASPDFESEIIHIKIEPED